MDSKHKDSNHRSSRVTGSTTLLVSAFEQNHGETSGHADSIPSDPPSHEFPYTIPILQGILMVVVWEYGMGVPPLGAWNVP